MYNVPSTWKAMHTEHYLDVVLSNTDPDYIRIYQRFISTGGPSSIVSVSVIDH